MKIDSLTNWTHFVDSHQILSASMSPIVLISACGLVTLGLYNRLGSIQTRIQVFHQQKIEILKSLHSPDFDRSHPLLEMLDAQISRVATKARWIQQGLICQLAAISCFLVCSLFSGATELSGSFGVPSLGAGAIGIVLFLGGLGCATRELLFSISPFEEEDAYLKTLASTYQKKSGYRNKTKIAESA